MQFLQWNCRGLGTSAPDLQAAISGRRPIAVCLQETKLAVGSRFAIKGYKMFRKDLRSDTLGHGGVILAVHNGIPSQNVDLNTPLQAVAARVQIETRSFTLCSLYFPPGIRFPDAEFRRLLTELHPPYVLMGDFNAHHVAWGCDHCCARGRSLERLINEESLCVLNTGTRTHFTLPSGRTSVLDLTLCSPQLAQLFNWTVDDDPLGSDHFPIWLEYRDGPVLESRPPRWNFRKADWNDFNTRIETGLNSPGAADSMESFTSLIVCAAEASIPKTSGCPKRPPVPWWTDECRDVIRARKRAYRAFDRHSTTENLIAFRKARALARRTIQDAKRASWRRYVSGLNQFTPVAQVWSQLRRISGSYAPSPLPVLTVGDREILAPAEVANEFGRSIADRCSLSGSNPAFLRHKARHERTTITFASSEQLPFNQPFTITELRSAVDGLRSVAEGPDQVHNDMIRHFPPRALDVLLSLFNELWETGQFPDAWREAVVIPLLKPGKTGSDPRHYRPISLTSALCKLFEKLVNSRLSWFLEQRNIFAESQCGFRKNRSTVDHLVTFDTVVRTAFKQRHHVGAVFFDIEAAYDTAWRHGILMKAYRYGIRGNMGRFLQNYLKERFFRVRVGHQLSDRFRQKDGVPQGGVLSVALFALMINDVVDVLPRPIGRSLFVDDLAIWAASSSTRAMERQLQLAVARLEQWASINGFKFSTEKTVAAHFCRRRSCPSNLAVTLHGQTIPVRSPVKFLGMELDSRFTYRDHFKTLKAKCLKALNILKCVSRTSYGADRKTLLLLYRSLIRSKLDYACVAYDAACLSSKRSLDVIHHAALRIATGAFRTSPIASVLVEADEMPLALRRKTLSMRYATRLLQFPSHPTYRVVFSKRTLSLLRRGGPERTFPLSVRFAMFLDDSGFRTRFIERWKHPETPPWSNITPVIDVSLSDIHKNQISPEESRSRALELIASYNDYMAIYTDGSKTLEGVGSAFICGDTIHQFSMPSNASVFTAELVAIRNALHFIRQSDANRHVILTDSLSSLMALRVFNPSHVFLTDILTLLTTLDSEGKEVVLCWIPAHVQIAGNEKADLAAREAAGVAPAGRFPLPASDFKRFISSFTRAEWQQNWDAIRINKLKILKPRLGRWQSSYRRSRGEEVALCRLRLGHTYATHKHLICGEDRPRCPKCGEYLTVSHVLVSCAHLSRERVRFFGTNTLTMPGVLGDVSPFIPAVFNFLAHIRFKVIFSSDT